MDSLVHAYMEWCAQDKINTTPSDGCAGVGTPPAADAHGSLLVRAVDLYGK